jgi:hypothetical protein
MRRVMTGEERERALFRMLPPGVVLAIAVGLAIGGIRFGSAGTRTAASWAIGLLLPLLAVTFLILVGKAAR